MPIICKGHTLTAKIKNGKKAVRIYKNSKLIWEANTNAINILYNGKRLSNNDNINIANNAGQLTLTLENKKQTVAYKIDIT